ncbi:MAG: asparagine synthase (glutamine-hydrolyzing) [Clostridia bacterium]|jgi:asparagine synthase (glutamine-hydrolysing)|nr:asparagine synthase (glutamine-hydrolyzing) [Clostridia bacterium]
MCGISGWISYTQDLSAQDEVIGKMMKTMARRGPDDAGKFMSPHCAFGHRRLEVVDPVGGAQPMIRYKDGKKYIICYNGELYNTPELRAQLAAKNYTFQAHSDTEVLLSSYIEWGAECIEKLNGIFALAIWDEFEQTLLLARDRFGIKPLFYTAGGGSLIFASELKAMLAHPDVQPNISEEGLAEVLIMGPARTPGHGIYDGVREVLPGHLLLFNQLGLKKIKYWSLKSEPHLDDLNTTAEKLKQMLENIIKNQLVSDVPVCTLLSGGLDSSVITAFASQALKESGQGPLHSYIIDYKDNDKHFQQSEFQPNSDTPWALRVSEHLGVIPHLIVVDTPQLADTLYQATLAKDLPGQADVDSSLYLFCKEIKKNATVALSGECADEILGGYPWFHDPELLNRRMFPWVRFLEHRVSLWQQDLFKTFSPEEYLMQRYDETIAEVPRLDGEDPLEAKRREMFYLNMNWFMQALLDRKDRMSMANGLEVRVPFADHQLIEYIWNIPWKYKTHGNESKGILRLAMEGTLPDDVLHRKKSPYPKTHNPNYDTAVRALLTEILDDPAAPLHQVIDEKQIRALMNAGGDVFNKPFFGQLMRGPQMLAYLIQVNIWLKEYKVTIK